MDLSIPMAFLASAMISYNNSVVVAGPLISMGIDRRIARIASGISIAFGALALGWAMKTPQRCGWDSALGAYIAILIPMLFSTYLGIPFSASIALIGSRVGGDLAVGLIDYTWITGTSILWLASGLLVFILTIAIYKILGMALWSTKRISPILGASRAVVAMLSIASGILLGGNTLGFLSSLECHRLLWLIALGGAAASLPGSAMLEGMFRWFSVRHLSASSIQISVVAGIAIATLLGLPLSHTYALMLSAAGYSASSGMSIFSRKQLLRAAKSWICSLAIGMAISWGVGVLKVYLALA
ncbi:MAG: hypothetical protein QXE01_12180 [Sulfolobales archaeon]